MMTWFEFLDGRKTMGDVIPFEKPERQIEHVDSSTIVERLELTEEMKEEFRKQGYTFEEDDNADTEGKS